MKTINKFLAASLFAFAIPIISLRAPFPFAFQNYGNTASPSFPTAVNSGVNSNTSLNWSGYISTQGSFTSVSGAWNIPAVASANSTMADATWVGIGGVSSHDLIQAGTQALTNPSGGVTYQAWYELLPQDMQTIPLTVNAGDSISVSLTQTATGVWQISFTDRTTGGTYSTTVDYNSSLSSAEWIEEMPTANIGFLPLDNFGSVSFTGGSAIENGNTVTIAGSAAQPITMVTQQSGQTLASPTSLGVDGASFTVTRTNVVATAPASTRYFIRSTHWRVGVGISRYSRSGASSTSVTSITIPMNANRWFRIFQSLRSEINNGRIRGTFTIIRF